MEVSTQYHGVSYAAKSAKTTAFSGKTTNETANTADQFKMLVEKIQEEHKLTPDNISVKDWREMDDEGWNKLLENVDQYIDDYKERLEQLEEKTKEAAIKAGAEAPADQRATAISSAILRTMVNGTTSGNGSLEASDLEKLSWTYEMETDDQIILATAKLANEAAHNALTKTQEMALTGDTTVGISPNESDKE